MGILTEKQQQVNRPILVHNKNGDFSLDPTTPEPMRLIIDEVFWRMHHAGGWITEILRTGEIRYRQVTQ